MQIFAASELTDVIRDKDRERRDIYNDRGRLREIYSKRARVQEQRLQMIEQRRKNEKRSQEGREDDFACSSNWQVYDQTDKNLKKGRLNTSPGLSF